MSAVQRQRLAELRHHADEFVRSIIDDHTGDEAFARACALARLPHPYSFNNLSLIEWQTGGDSALVCSKGAFDRMAREQGHQTKTFRSAKGKSWTQAVVLRRGCSAVWILAPCSWLKAVTDEDTGEETKVPVRHYRGVPVYRSEDVLYCDTGEPFQVPSLLGSIPTGAEELVASLASFCQARGIVVRRSAALRAGNDGQSWGGTVVVRGGAADGVAHALLHEVMHEVLHPLETRTADRDRRLHEGECEAAVATVLLFLGHETPLSSAYLRNHGCQPDEVSRSLSRIVGAAHEIIEWLREGRLVDRGGTEAALDGGETEMAAA